MTFQLPDLPYAFDALEPHIDARTMEIHHDKHHAGYTKNLNAALEGHADWQAKSISEILSSLSQVPEDIRTAVRNNGGGFANHSLFWTVMSPDGGGEAQAMSDRPSSVLSAISGVLRTSSAALPRGGSAVAGPGWPWMARAGSRWCPHPIKICPSPTGWPRS